MKFKAKITRMVDGNSSGKRNNDYNRYDNR